MEGEYQSHQIKMQSDDITPLNNSLTRLINAQQRVMTSLVKMAKTYSGTAMNNILSEESKSDAQKKVSQQTIAALKSEIMEFERDLSNIPAVIKGIKELGICIQKKWEVVKNGLQNKLVEKYRPMQIFLKEKIESIEELRSSHDLAKQKSLSLVADGSTDYQMDKVNEEIDSVKKRCDEVELKIAKLKKSYCGLTEKLVQIRESNEEINQKIRHANDKRRHNVDTISDQKKDAQVIRARILERSREIQAIKGKKISLKVEQAHLISSLNDITTKNGILDIEVNELKLMLKNKQQLAAFQYTEVNGEQQQINEKEPNQLELMKKSFLINEEKMQEQICALQHQLNVRQSQLDALKQIQNQILEKEQYLTAAASKLTAQQATNSSKLKIVHNLLNRIVDKRSRMVETLKRRAQWLQDSRPAKIPSLRNEIEVSSTTLGIPMFEEQDDERLQE